MAKRFWLLTKQEYLIAKAARFAGRWSFRRREEERLEEERLKAEQKQRAQDRAAARRSESERVARLSIEDLAHEGIACFQRKTDRTGRKLCLLIGKVPWVREALKLVGGPIDHFRRECVLEALEGLTPREENQTEPVGGRVQLLDWLYSARERADYLERACVELPPASGLIEILQRAQALERADVASRLKTFVSQLGKVEGPKL
jgi:hypothetical protein